MLHQKSKQKEVFVKGTHDSHMSLQSMLNLLLQSLSIVICQSFHFSLMVYIISDILMLIKMPVLP